MRTHDPKPKHRRLIAAAVASLAAVGLTLRFDQSTVDRGVAVAVAVAAVAALVVTRYRARLAAPPLLLIGAFMAAVAAPALAAHAVRVGREDTPQATIRNFLAAAVVDRDGTDACKYLSPRARISFEDHSATFPDCATFFAGAHLTLGGLTVQSNADLKALSYRTIPEGRDRLVWVSHGDQGMLFALAPASATDRNEFRGPHTPWRIDSGIAALGSPTLPALGPTATRETSPTK